MLPDLYESIVGTKKMEMKDVTRNSDEELWSALSSSPLQVQLNIEPDRKRNDLSIIGSKKEDEPSARNSARRRIQIKASIVGRESRRLRFDPPVSLVSLKAEISRELGLQGSPDSIEFTYTEKDNDKIHIETDPELQLVCEPGSTGHRITFSTKLQPQQPQELPPLLLLRRRRRSRWLPCCSSSVCRRRRRRHRRDSYAIEVKQLQLRERAKMKQEEFILRDQTEQKRRLQEEQDARYARQPPRRRLRVQLTGEASGGGGPEQPGDSERKSSIGRTGASATGAGRRLAASISSCGCAVKKRQLARKYSG
jgi:hypothetical protein